MTKIVKMTQIVKNYLKYPRAVVNSTAHSPHLWFPSSLLGLIFTTLEHGTWGCLEYNKCFPHLSQTCLYSEWSVCVRRICWFKYFLFLAKKPHVSHFNWFSSLPWTQFICCNSLFTDNPQSGQMVSLSLWTPWTCLLRSYLLLEFLPHM